MLLSRYAALLQSVGMVTVALLWSYWLQWRDNSLLVIFSSSCGIYCNIEEIFVLFCLFASVRLWSLSSAALYGPTDYFSCNNIEHRFLPFTIPWQDCHPRPLSHWLRCLSGLTEAYAFSLCPGPNPFIAYLTKYFLPVFLSSLLTAHCAIQSLFRVVFYWLIYHAVAIICRVAFHCIISRLDAFIFSPVIAQKAPQNGWLESKVVYYKTNNVPR